MFFFLFFSFFAVAWRPSGRALSRGSSVPCGSFTTTCGRWNQPNCLLLLTNGHGTPLLTRPKFASAATSILITDGLPKKAGSSFGTEFVAKEKILSAKSSSNCTASSAASACSRLWHNRYKANVNVMNVLATFFNVFFFLFLVGISRSALVPRRDRKRRPFSFFSCRRILLRRMQPGGSKAHQTHSSRQVVKEQSATSRSDSMPSVPRWILHHFRILRLKIYYLVP